MGVQRVVPINQKIHLSIEGILGMVRIRGVGTNMGGARSTPTIQ